MDYCRQCRAERTTKNSLQCEKTNCNDVYYSKNLLYQAKTNLDYSQGLLVEDIESSTFISESTIVAPKTINLRLLNDTKIWNVHNATEFKFLQLLEST